MYVNTSWKLCKTYTWCTSTSFWKIAQSVRRTPGTQNMTIFNRDAKSLEKACVSYMFSYFCLEKQMFAITNHLNSPPPKLQPNMVERSIRVIIWHITMLNLPCLDQCVNLHSSLCMEKSRKILDAHCCVDASQRSSTCPVETTSLDSPNYPTRDSWGFGGLVFSSPICREIKWKKSSPNSWDITEPVRMKWMKWFGAMTMVHLAHRWKKRAPSFHRFSIDVSLPCPAVVPLPRP